MDVFYPTSNEPDGPQSPQSPQGAPPAESSVAGGVALSTGAPGNHSAVPDGACPADTAQWQTWLEQSGFSHAEASRLVFERLRPRAEGTARA